MYKINYSSGKNEHGTVQFETFFIFTQPLSLGDGIAAVLQHPDFLGIVCKEGWLQESICMLPVCFVFSLK